MQRRYPQVVGLDRPPRRRRPDNLDPGSGTLLTSFSDPAGLQARSFRKKWQEEIKVRGLVECDSQPSLSFHLLFSFRKKEIKASLRASISGVILQLAH
ncbi:Os05g0537001 [Oryza sativa Japonica Group]|uniref:Os05g0537001 protein n=1 Tax=Oryza sativa subsp. japonica TaxID=39947 RepID=A0A0P0WPL6_ORYSJ|nr:Os05g0537001 [Oryza sativa Japonica Group]